MAAKRKGTKKAPKIVDIASEELIETVYKKPTSTRMKRVLLLVIVLGILGYFFKSLFVAALVNGQPITRLAVVKELEKRSGQETVDNLITEALILQEAKKQKVSVSKDEVNSEVKELEETFTAQGQNLDELLLAQGMDRAELEHQIRVQKMIEKMVGKDIEVTDEEINQYLEDNEELLPQDQKPEDLRETVKQQLQQQKLSSKVQTWLEEIRQKASIRYIVNY
jgi:foldase protein PrsA